MRSYNIRLPRGIKVDIFNLPEDFDLSEAIQMKQQKNTDIVTNWDILIAVSSI